MSHISSNNNSSKPSSLNYPASFAPSPDSQSATNKSAAKNTTSSTPSQYDSSFEQSKSQCSLPSISDSSGNRNLGAMIVCLGLSSKQGPIIGDEMTLAIIKSQELGGDLAANLEVFAQLAKDNPGKLSPEAQQVLATYEKYVKAAQANGQTSIDPASFKNMVAEMNAVKGGNTPPTSANQQEIVRADLHKALDSALPSDIPPGDRQRLH